MSEPIPSVKELRKLGYKVVTKHVRRFHRYNEQTGKITRFIDVFMSNKRAKKLGKLAPDGLQVSNQEKFFVTPKGGGTIVEIYKDDLILTSAQVKCSNDELYVKKEGVNRCLELIYLNFNPQTGKVGR